MAAVKHRFRLKKRDCDILRFIYDSGFATSEHLRVEFWNRTEAETHFRRLRTLKQNALIEAIEGDRGQRLGYRLTAKGMGIVKSVATEEQTGTRAYKSTIDHDTLLVTIWQILKRSPLVSNYKPELKIKRELAKKHGLQKERDERYKVPDAIFTLKTTKRSFSVALELELSTKSKERYLRLFKLLCTSSDFELIFFIAKDDQLLSLLKANLSEVREKDPLVRIWRVKNGFYFVLLSELLEKGLGASFQGEDSEFSLAGLADDVLNAGGC